MPQITNQAIARTYLWAGRIFVLPVALMFVVSAIGAFSTSDLSSFEPAGIAAITVIGLVFSWWEQWVAALIFLSGSVIALLLAMTVRYHEFFYLVALLNFSASLLTIGARLLPKEKQGVSSNQPAIESNRNQQAKLTKWLGRAIGLLAFAYFTRVGLLNLYARWPSSFRYHTLFTIAFIALAGLLISWWKGWAASVFMLLGVIGGGIYAIRVPHDQWVSFFAIAGPCFVAGILFFASWLLSQRRPKPA